MAGEKRPRVERNHDKPIKKQRTGFQVGPANLPDGTYKRKAQKIKSSLIQRAKIKKDFAKLKARRLQEEDTPAGQNQPSVYDRQGSEAVSDDGGVDEDTSAEGSKDVAATSLQPHPSRAHLVGKGTTSRSPSPELKVRAPGQDKAEIRKPRRPKFDPYRKEASAAQKQREEAEVRRQRRIRANEERLKKIEDRERFRKAMAKARKPGVDGKRKLGRESNVLLEKVRRLVER